MTGSTLQELCAAGLTFAPSQVHGNIRIVPLLRNEVRGDLRMGIRPTGEDVTFVDLGGGKNANHVWYCSYVPHGMVVNWSSQGEPVATFGGQLSKRSKLDPTKFSVGFRQRLVRRESKNRLHMLPLHVAMEGFLSLHFGGPRIAWSEYATTVSAHGLSPREEETYTGAAVEGLDHALRVFEMHETQCGAMVFVGDELAAVTIVGHPDDYRSMHRSLLRDFYGPLILRHAGATYSRPGVIEASIAPTEITSIAGLRDLASAMRADHAAAYASMGRELFDRELNSNKVYKLAPFSLERFMTDLNPQRENHIGECIRRGDGTVEYLKTFRLSAAQTRRAYLLQQLAAHEWELEATAKFFKTDHPSFVLRLENAGFGYMLKPHVLEEARRKKR